MSVGFVHNCKDRRMSKVLMRDLTQDKTPKNEKFHPERKEIEKLSLCSDT